MKWNLKGLKFLLSHIEGFIDTEVDDLRKRARQFEVQTGLETVERLVEATSPQAQRPEQILERLTPFFESGILVKDLQVTDVFWRGSVFHLDADEQTSAQHILQSINPLQVQRAEADKVLNSLNMDFLLPSPEAQGYLLRPTPDLGYILFSNLAQPWAVDHIAHTHRLINKAFIY